MADVISLERVKKVLDSEKGLAEEDAKGAFLLGGRFGRIAISHADMGTNVFKALSEAIEEIPADGKIEAWVRDLSAEPAFVIGAIVGALEWQGEAQ